MYLHTVCVCVRAHACVRVRGGSAGHLLCLWVAAVCQRAADLM